MRLSGDTFEAKGESSEPRGHADSTASVSAREYLLDASRLIWRFWSGRLPTGIDRVCLEYVARFGPRSQAVVQFKGLSFVLSAADSDRLFALMTQGETGLRKQLLGILVPGILRARRSSPRRGMLFLNVGHTGLHQPSLPAWVARTGVRAVYLIHDVIPITHPQFCRPGEAAKHRLRMRNALASAAGIVCNSQATCEELGAFAAELGLSMPPNVTAWISGPRLPEPVTPKHLGRPHFVTVGTIEGRKNHILLLQVWRSLVAEMGNQAPILVIVGQRGWEAEAAQAMLDEPQELAGHVLELGRCGDQELAGWLLGARALLMPSFVEGFGLPVIEALQLGTPAIASDLPVYREIVGEIPTYLDPLDQSGWERAIRDYMADSAERARQVRAMQGYRPPDWQSHFARVEDWLSRL